MREMYLIVSIGFALASSIFIYRLFQEGGFTQPQNIIYVLAMLIIAWESLKQSKKYKLEEDLF